MATKTVSRKRATKRTKNSQPKSKSRIKSADGSAKTKKTTRKVTHKKRKPAPRHLPTHIVGIGASAGGLEAIESFFRAVSHETGFAFVIVQHLSPDFKSLMEELMPRYTKMRIHRVEDGMTVEQNAIYLIPPKKEMVVKDGELRLKDREPVHNLNLPIDIFFHSLAEDYGDKAIGAIFSGTGSDGSRGIKSIHDAGGLVLVQNEDSAKFDGMPKSAIATGLADYILSPDEMPEVLTLHAERLLDSEGFKSKRSIIHSDKYKYNEICTVLMNKYGIDFTYYKPSTVGRRIERRMSMGQFLSLDDYVDSLQQDAEELEALYKDLLIGVTEFFRDKEAFAVVQKQVIPRILENSDEEDEIRIWVPACATGEEPYSLAILFREAMKKVGRLNNVKVFATDVHKLSLEKAATGQFPETSIANISKTFLNRYFTKNPDGYRISSEIRKMVVFAEHNLIKDPPFTKLDLVSCRNLLIYLQPVAQKKAISLMHFALKTNGTLLLGPSETLGVLDKEFTTLDTHWKIYTKRRDVRITDETQFGGMPITGQRRIVNANDNKMSPQSEIRVTRAYEALLQKYVPPSILVDENRTLIHTFGNARDFLRPPAGKVELDVLSMVDGDLRIAISTALQKAKKDHAEVIYRGVKFPVGIEVKDIQVVVRPLSDRTADLSYFLVVLEEIQRKVKPQKDSGDRDSGFEAGEEAKGRIEELEEELQFTKEHLQATVEELETSNEELQATNEELLASNEELQSTNEELHSVNEELYTVNGEYERKINELTQLNNDMDNLLESTQIGTIFLDKDLRIRKFTPAISASFNILPQDINRPLEHLASRIINHPDMFNDVQKVVATGEVLETEVQNDKGLWFLERILPYMDDNGETVGVVITYLDIDSAIKTAITLSEKQRTLQVALQSIDAGVWQWYFADDSVHWDSRMEQLFGYKKGTFPGTYEGFRAKVHPDDIEATEKAVKNAVEGVERFDVIYRTRPLRRKNWRYTRAIGQLLLDDQGASIGMVGLCHDVTDDVNRRRRLEDTLQELSEKNRLVEGILETSPAILYVYDLENNRNIFSNSGISDLLGYSPTAVKKLGNGLLKSLMHKEDFDKYLRNIVPLYASAGDGEVVVNQYRMKHKKGGWVWLESREVVHARTESGQPTEIMGVATDITGDIQQRREMKTVLETTRDGFWVTSKTGKLLEVNDAYSQMIGYSRQELLKMSILDLKAIENPKDARARMKRLVKHGYDRSFTKHRTKNGSTRDIDVSMTYLDVDGGKFYAFLRDVTHQKESEAMVAEEREKLLAMFDSLDDLVYVCDPDTYELVFVNDAMKAVHGEKLIGEKCYEKIQGKTKPCDFCSNDTILAKPGEPYTWEYKNESTGRWYRCVDKAIRWKSDKLMRLEFASDITDKNEAMEKLESQTQELAKANSDLEQFAYFISHDLKEPLRSISGFSQIIQKRYLDKLDERGRTYLETMVESSENLASMIDAVLDYSRMSRERVAVKKIDTEKLLGQVQSSLMTKIKESRAKINLTRVDEFYGDRSLFGRLFQNLISNSLKYRSKTAPRITVRVETKGNSTRISVKDNGIGIDKENRDSVFQPFRRVHSRTEVDGHGMGLTICRKIVESHGGKIWIESNKGKGTKVLIELPGKGAGEE